MDLETRNEFEHYCALAEIEQDADQFVEIKRSIIRLLDEKESRLNRKRRVTGPAERWIIGGSDSIRKVSLLDVPTISQPDMPLSLPTKSVPES
jgi:hypothetical protein